MKKTALTGVVLLAAAAQAWAAGFSLFQGDSTGIANPPESIAKGGRIGDLYYNPATLAGLESTNAIQVGCFFTRPHLKVNTTSPYTGEKAHTAAKSQWFQIPHLYAAHRISDSWVAGFGLFSRVGLGDRFPENWAGRYNNTRVDFYTFDFAPTIAWKATDWLSVGGGITLQYFDIALEQDIDAAGIAGARNYNDPTPSPYDVHQRIHGSDSLALGWDAGIQLKPLDWIHLGLAYHSEVEAHAKGHARYTVPATIRAMYPMFFQYTPAKGNITEPDYWMGALAIDVTKRITVGASITRSGWSSWDALIIDEEKPFLPGHGRLQSVKNWDDVWRWSVGASCKITDEWSARLSYTYDDSPIDRNHADYIVPADTRQIYAFGLSYETGPWIFDAAYFYEDIKDMSYDGRPAEGVFTGKYTDGFAHSFAVSLGYNF